VLPTVVQLDPSRLVVFSKHGSSVKTMATAWFEGGSPYSRDASPDFIKGSPSWVFRLHGIAVSGAARTLLGKTYRLMIDGTEAARATPVDDIADFTVQTAGLAEGWRMLEVESDGGESCIPWFAFVQHGADPVPQERMPVFTQPHDCQKRGWAMWAYAWVPARSQPVTLPLAPRVTPAFSGPKDRRSLIERHLVPGQIEAGPVYYTRVTNGVMHTEQEEGYYFYSIGAKMPRLALLDGPRGAGTIVMPMHIQVSHTGGAWVCEAWRVCMVFPDGEVRTLAGRRHKSPAHIPPQGENTDADLLEGTELVGDWSEIPEPRRGFHELWGLAWDQRTLHPHDPTAEPIMVGGAAVKPHVRNPLAFLPDSLNSRICTIEGDRRDPTLTSTPIKVREFKTGLSDPWDCVCVDGVLYVSERGANRIAAYDADTGDLLRVVVDGGPTAGLLATGATPPAGWLAYVRQQDRFVRRAAAIDKIRALPCCLPEGLYHLDGWLYFGSIAAGQVRRVNLTTGELQIVVKDITYNYASTNFCKIAVSDGSFGPRGSVFVCTWALAPRGRPMAWLPDGTPWAYNTTSYLYGPGLEWGSVGYHSAVGVGGGPSTLPPDDPGFEASSRGKLIYGTSSYGLREITLAQGERAYTAAECKAMDEAWYGRALQIKYGHGGWGQYGEPQPWGVDADVDAYLEAYGHQRPG
jgi:hypothetical protein